MSVKTKQLKDLLNLDEQDFKKLSVDQLRLMLGVFHYISRLMQREINSRSIAQGKKV